MSNSTLDRLSDPARSRAVLATHNELEEALEHVADCADQFMRGPARPPTPDGRPLALADALDALTICEQSIHALIALGQPSWDAIYPGRTR